MHEHVRAKWQWPIADAAACLDTHLTTTATVCKHNDWMIRCLCTLTVTFSAAVFTALAQWRQAAASVSCRDVCVGGKWGNRDQYRWVWVNVSGFSGGLRDGWTIENARPAAVQQKRLKFSSKPATGNYLTMPWVVFVLFCFWSAASSSSSCSTSSLLLNISPAWRLQRSQVNMS